MIVYRIKNKQNGKLYFGITKCRLKKRWNEHKCKSKTGKSHLHNAMRKYGIDSFDIETVKVCDSEDEMYSLEVSLIKNHKTNNPKYGYNNSIGGEKSSLGKRLSEEVKAKISKSQKGKKRRPHSIEARKKMSESAKGRDMSKAVNRSAQLRRGQAAKNRRPVVLCDGRKFESISEAAAFFGISIGCISNNLNGISKKTKVGRWEYVKTN
jgi:group I intron endonuclease